jgi:hypothetical protein
VFEDVGKAYCIGLLDFIDKNPVSRISQSIFKDIEGVKQELLSKNPIFIPKAKEEPPAPKTLRSSSTKRLIVIKPQPPQQKVRVRTHSTGAPELNKMVLNIP